MTNAIVHAHSSTRVTLIGTESALRVSVRDYWPLPRPGPTDRHHRTHCGRGLHLVAAVAQTWGMLRTGIRRRRHTDRFWFEHAGAQRDHCRWCGDESVDDNPLLGHLISFSDGNTLTGIDTADVTLMSHTARPLRHYELLSHTLPES